MRGQSGITVAFMSNVGWPIVFSSKRLVPQSRRWNLEWENDWVEKSQIFFVSERGKFDLEQFLY